MGDPKTIIDNATNILIISGAGLSKASGIPTFRDSADGLWENFKVEDVSCSTSDMNLVSAFYQNLYRKYYGIKPNGAHHACAELEKYKNVLHVTQNVDGLLQSAGCKNVVEIHGSFSDWLCVDCETHIDPSEGFNCPTCSSTKIRPNAVLFGESLDPLKINTALDFLKRQAHVIITIGTSGVVAPVSQWTMLAKGRNIPVIAINPTRPDNHHDIWLSGKCEEIIPAIVADIKGQI